MELLYKSPAWEDDHSIWKHGPRFVILNLPVPKGRGF